MGKALSPKSKDKWYERASVKALVLAIITSIMLVLLVTIRPAGYDSIISQIFIIILSATASASFSYWVAADSYTKSSDKRLKSYALSAVRHLGVVFADTHRIHERMKGIIQNFDGYNENINKANVIEALENMASMMSSLETHIRLGESNWQGIFEEEIMFAEPEYQDMVKDDREATENIMHTQKLESLGILAGGIAHDFNNLLHVILGNISLAKTTDIDNRIENRLEDAEEACKRARELTQQLLTFSKGGTPVRKATSIEKLLHEWVNFALRGSNVSCEFSISDDLWGVEIDEGQINQVINNLVINAIQAMPQGGTIKVCAKNTNIREIDGLPLKNGKYVTISVIDYGIGIPTEFLHKIYDPYFTTKPNGSGLGLTIVYSIIKKHDGYILAESQVGHGSAFHIYLPAYRKKIQVIDKEEKLSMEEKIPVKGKGRILVMDDEESITELAKATLSVCGYEVSIAENGNKAIDLYEKALKSGKSFDVVILDLTIPGDMGGKETIQKLQKIDPDIIAIVSSGYSDNPVLANFEGYGFSGVIAKPYKPGDLINVLNKAISERTKSK